MALKYVCNQTNRVHQFEIVIKSYVRCYLRWREKESERVSVGGYARERDEDGEAQPWCGPERDNCLGQRCRLGD